MSKPPNILRPGSGGEDDDKRPSASQRGYGSDWRKLVKQVKEEEPFCRTCGPPVVTTQVDHIIPKSQGGTDDRSNLQGLCDPCHWQKTAFDSGFRK